MWSRPQSFPHWGRYFHEGINTQISEGLHFALAIEELGLSSLDAFLRHLLTQLTFFRGIVDHPGFNWSSDLNTGIKLQYLATITHETDPELKKQNAEKYAKQIREEFALMNERRDRGPDGT